MIFETAGSTQSVSLPRTIDVITSAVMTVRCNSGFTCTSIDVVLLGCESGKHTGRPLFLIWHLSCTNRESIKSQQQRGVLAHFTLSDGDCWVCSGCSQHRISGFILPRKLRKAYAGTGLSSVLLF